MLLASTPFTELVGCRLPVQQAAMGGVTTPALAAAVARAGGLGMIAAAGLSASTVVDDVTAALDGAGAGGRVGVGFLMPFLDEAALEAAATVAALVECFYGDPVGAVVERVHAAGALVGWQVGSPEEARAAEDAGCDLVVVQGSEAGGHVRGTTALLPLLHEVRARTGLPLLAAGGIGSGGAVAAALAAGADGVRVGTRFVATVEADAHHGYVAALIDAGPQDTVLTQAFSLGWPDAPHRVLRRCVDPPGIGSRPRSPVPPTRSFTGDVASSALYAGASVGEVTSITSAADVVAELVHEAAEALAGPPAEPSR